MMMTYGHGGAQQSSLSFEQDSCVDVVVRLMLAMRIVMIVFAHDYGRKRDRAYNGEMH